jgi:hypothetical protein
MFDLTSPTTVVAAALAAASTAACLDPQVSDQPPGGLGILPAGSELRSIHDDPLLDARIDEQDGVGRLVALQTGFAGGAQVHSWDFGPTVDFAAPIFALRRRNAGGGLDPIAGHSNIFDVIPGDPGYSPYWSVWFVEVTDAYGGEVIPSVAALQEAERIGLVNAPELQDVAVNCPVVHRDVRLDQGDGVDPAPPNSSGYYRGAVVAYYDFGPMPLFDGVHVPAADRYRLRREGGEPLHELERAVDMTGDGDVRDSNDLFAVPPGDPDATPLCRSVSVIVPAAYGSIDTYGSDAMADATSAADLFDPDGAPVDGAVIAFAVTEELRNCPYQAVSP